MQTFIAFAKGQHCEKMSSATVHLLLQEECQSAELALARKCSCTGYVATGADSMFRSQSLRFI